MSNQRLTQCPHCKASFKVSEEQLSAANGRVRCGACMNIFDAIAYSLSDTEKKTANNPSPEPSEDQQSSAIDLEDSLLESEDKLFADNPEEDLHEPGYSGSADGSDEFSTSFLELDSADNSDPYSTSFKKLDDTFVSEESEEIIDESWTQEILEDIQDEQGKQKVEPTFSASAIEQASVTQAETSSESAFGEPGSDFSETSPYEKIEFQYDQDSPNNRHWLVSLLFILANISLIVILLGQAVWFHYEKLAKYPKVSELYELACEHLSCTLPKLEDIEKIKSNNLVVRSHPTQRKSLIIDTVIVNEAAFNQAFPDLALYFSDINKNIVAQRLFKAKEYLSGDLASWHEMPSQQPIHISLEIVDPGKEAVNYSLKFFSPQP